MIFVLCHLVTTNGKSEKSNDKKNYQQNQPSDNSTVFTFTLYRWSLLNRYPIPYTPFSKNSTISIQYLMTTTMNKSILKHIE